MIRCSFSTFTENKSKPRELPKGSVVNSLFFDLTMLRLRIERHQIAARNYDDDDHHSFIGSIIIAIMRFFISPAKLDIGSALLLSLLLPPFYSIIVELKATHGAILNGHY